MTANSFLIRVINFICKITVFINFITFAKMIIIVFLNKFGIKCIEQILVANYA